MSVKVPLCDLTISDDTEQRQIELVVVALTYCATKLWPGRPERVRQAHEEAAQLRAVLAHMQGRGGGTNSSSSCATPAMGEAVGDRVANEAISTATSTPSCTATTTTTTTPSALTGRCKDGHNGLSVVSADVIVCKKAAKPSRSREAKDKANNTSVTQQQRQHSSHRPHTNGTAAAHTDTQDEASTLVAVDSAEMQQSRRNKEESVEAHDMQLPIPLHTTTLCDETGEHVEGNAVSATRSPSRRQVMAATTPQGLVVLVNECGSPLTSEELADTLACHVCLPLNVVRLSGGITNELFHVFDATDASTSVVIRVFGKETERVISRESELFYQSLFLRTYLHGANFLVYEFLHAYAVLPYTAMPHEGPAIASVLADFQVRATRAAQADHAAPLLPIPPALVGGGGKKKSDASNPCNTEEVHTLRNGHTKELHGSRYAKEDNYTLHSLTRWVAQVGEEEIRAKVMPGKQADFANLVQALTRECAWMRDVLQRHRASLAEGVCHNDLLSANIMRHCETGGLKIIDFDYTKRNFVLYDIANHFNEYTGLECDYARYFPTEAQMAEFIAAYRQAMRDCLRHYQQDEQQQTHHRPMAQSQCTTSSSSSSHIGNGACVVQNGNSSSTHIRMHCTDRSSRHMDNIDVSDVKDIIADAAELFWSASEEAEQAKVLEWTRLVKLLTLASHLSWSVWSLLQEAVSALDVDFLDYAKLRFARYVATKESFASGM